MEIKFDQQKLKIVPIEQVRPNTWNPKDKNTPEFEKIKQGIKLKGLRMPIVVRELAKDEYEIIDGEQRYTACKELGFKNILIYNEGKVSDQEARELTIWYQQQVPFNEIELLPLIKEIVSYTGEYQLPYTEKEVEERLKMLEFDWEKYQKEQDSIEKKENMITCPECGHQFYK